MALLPDKTELAEIRRALTESGADPHCEAAAIDAFAAGAFTAETVDSWFALTKHKRPELWQPPKAEQEHSDDDEGEHADLIEQAFDGAGNVTARGKLLKAIGQEAADKAAKRWGLKGFADYKSRGTKPNKDKPEGNGKEKTTNPFLAAAWNVTEQARLVRINPAMAGALAKAAGVAIGSTKPVR